MAYQVRFRLVSYQVSRKHSIPGAISRVNCGRCGRPLGVPAKVSELFFTWYTVRWSAPVKVSERFLTWCTVRWRTPGKISACFLPGTRGKLLLDLPARGGDAAQEGFGGEDGLDVGDALAAEWLAGDAGGGEAIGGEIIHRQKGILCGSNQSFLY